MPKPERLAPYRRAWHVGLKTPFCLRSLGAMNNEQATVAVKKTVRRGIKEGQDGGQSSGDSGGSRVPDPDEGLL